MSGLIQIGGERRKEALAGFSQNAIDEQYREAVGRQIDAAKGQQDMGMMGSALGLVAPAIVKGADGLLSGAAAGGAIVPEAMGTAATMLPAGAAIAEGAGGVVGAAGTSAVAGGATAAIPGLAALTPALSVLGPIGIVAGLGMLLGDLF